MAKLCSQQQTKLLAFSGFLCPLASPHLFKDCHFLPKNVLSLLSKKSFATQQSKQTPPQCDAQHLSSVTVQNGCGVIALLLILIDKT